MLRDFKTMATTAYPELKAYGIETAGVQMPVWNLTQRVYVRPIVSCKEFNAFEIARRLGLSETIIQMP